MIRWSVGLLIGTLLFGVASPLFVRSYLPNEINRGVATLPTGYVYRWRSEGYANTRIGPLGMPGKTAAPLTNPTAANAGSSSLTSQSKRSLEPRQFSAEPNDDGPVVVHPSDNRVALWGDSQAEGVAVQDQDKLFAQIERASDGRWDVYPLAVSGDALGHWIAQFASVEQSLKIDRHLLLICELRDLLDLSPPPTTTPSGRLRGWTTSVPAFLVQSAKNVLLSDGQRFRSVRFRPGPLPTEYPLAIRSSHKRPISVENFGPSLDAIVASTSLPVSILYAPRVPIVIGGEIQWSDPDGRRCNQVSSLAKSLGVDWIDCTTALKQSGRSGKFPHGFNNGQIGVGHLNAVGYQILASELAKSDSYCEKGLRSTKADGTAF